MMAEPITYAAAGVDYAAMDPVKQVALRLGIDTERFMRRFGFKAVEWTRGQSVFVVETPFG